MTANAHPLLGVRISPDPYGDWLEVRIHDGSRPWVLMHAGHRYRHDGPERTANYLAKRYLVSRPDQLRLTNVAALTALLLAALHYQAAGSSQ